MARVSPWMRLDLRGGAPALSLLDTARRSNGARVEATLRVFAEGILTASKRLVPVDTGFLRSTGFVRHVRPLVFDVGYSAAYALAVHEVPPSRASHRPPTQWKFLETPAREAFGHIADRFADENLLED